MFLSYILLMVTEALVTDVSTVVLVIFELMLLQNQRVAKDHDDE